jgi:hypothetical protein
MRKRYSRQGNKTDLGSLNEMLFFRETMVDNDMSAIVAWPDSYCSVR